MGLNMSSGSIRMVNDDIIDLYSRIQAGAKVLLLMFALAACLVSGAYAQDEPSVTGKPNAKIEELLKLIDDPEVRATLEANRQARPEQPQSAVAGNVSRMDAAFRDHLSAMTAAMRRLPAEVSSAMQVLARAPGEGRVGPVFLILAILIPSLAAEWLVRRRIGRRTAVETSAGSPLREFKDRLLSKLAPLLVFGVAVIGIYLAVGASPIVRKIVGVYLVALIAARLVCTISNSLLEWAFRVQETGESPDEGMPLAGYMHSFWRRRVVIIFGYIFAAWATLDLLPAIGFSHDVQQLLGYIAGIGLLAIAIECVWRKPRAINESAYSDKWLLTIYLVVLWCVWAAGANVAFWIGLYPLVLPKLLSVIGKASRSFLAEPSEGGRGPSMRNVLIARGARALVILLAVAWIAFVLRMSPGILATSDDFGSRIVRSLLRAVLIVIAADLIWQLIKSWIDIRIAADAPVAGAPAAGRLRTLLPIFRNALAVVVITVAGLTILAEFGVQIGPLIAGAGIFGVAIGFGSQTLVKDIVSGIFYLMDDAFRVGEYIQSGSYKGTVEGFSLRSVRLRHHRGPVFTVPFGTLGAVQNMSRDWVIDKFIVRFPFDTNIKFVKKLTKTIGAELEADPELGPIILQTVKMKGVEQIGDYGIDISFAFMSKPGYQTSVRRRAYSMMTDLFAANGIEFARPSVHVGSEDHTVAAGAASALIARQRAADQA
jgi:small-conductance mechanosensitive channel